MLAMRLVVQSVHGYVIQQLSNHAGVNFDDREVIDVPLKNNEQVQAARELEAEFKEDGLSGKLRNGPNAITVISCEVVKL